MTVIGQHVVSMTRGEITPLAHGRIDLQDYQQGLHTLQNFIPLKYGGITRIPGTLDINACEDSTAKSRLLTYIFNQDQSYVLEFSDLVMRFHILSGTIEDGGSPVEVVTPYLQADLWKIQIESIGDVIYIACDGYQPRTLTRTSDTDWALALFVAEGGPWLNKPEDTTLTLAGTGFAVPSMTSASTPSGVVTSNSTIDTYGAAWYPFHHDRGAYVVTLFAAEIGWVQYDYGVGVEKTVSGYALVAVASTGYVDESVISWSLEGKKDGGSDWVVIDQHKRDSDWASGEVRVYEISNQQAYRYYRYFWTGQNTNSNGGTQAAVGKIELLLHPDEQTPFDVTASSIVEINGGDGFQSADVGRLIRVMCHDSFWRVMRIESVTSTTVVKCVVTGPAPVPEGTTAVSRWQISGWGEESGWPKAVGTHKGRLGWARTTTQPRHGWLSVAADYDNYGINQPLLPDDAITFGLAKGGMDQVLWITTNDNDMLLGTVGGIRVIGNRDDSAVFGPDNIEELGSTEERAGSVLPVWVGDILLFANKQLTRLYETTFSVDAGGYQAQELTMLAEHIFLSKVRELHFQPTPGNVLYAVLEDGQVGVCTYDRQQQVFGVGRLMVPGNDATVESMCVLPEDDYDVPFLVTKRTVDGTVQYRIERMLDPYRSGGLSSYDIPHYLMAAGRYTGAATATITGLDHLEGESVGVYDAAGTDLGDAAVASGQITVPGGGTVTDALVGLRYSSTARTLRPPNMPEDGKYMDRPATVVDVSLDLFETYGLRAGGSRHKELLRSEADFANSPDVPALHTGELRVPVDEGWSKEPYIELTTDKAYPATVRSMMVKLDRGS